MNVLAAFLLVPWAAADQPKLADLSSGAAELAEAFNRESGLVRMILIVSPG
jgi:hypothetical protein